MTEFWQWAIGFYFGTRANPQAAPPDGAELEASATGCKNFAANTPSGGATP